MLIVRQTTRSLTFKDIKRQSNGLRIELGVIQERQFAKFLEPMVATRETTSEPIKHSDHLHSPLTAASFEDGAVK